MFGFGYNGILPNANVYNAATPSSGLSDLWYSNYKEPWGFDNTNQVIPVGQSQQQDIAVGLASIGGSLMCFKTKTTWLLYGNSNQDFYINKLADVGCASRSSIAKAYGAAFWLSDQGVWMYDGSNLTNLSDGNPAVGGVKGILDTYAPADMAASVGFVHDHGYYLSFPTKGVTLVYDLRFQRWTTLLFVCDNAAFDLDNQNYAGGEVVGSNYSTAGEVDFWFASNSDLGAAIPYLVTSKQADLAADGATYRARYAQIEAPQEAGTSTFTVNMYAQAGLQSYSQVVPLGTPNYRYLYSLPPGFIGNQLYISISGQATTQTVLQRFSVLGWVERQFVIPG
jgi:hypothetical protein